MADKTDITSNSGVWDRIRMIHEWYPLAGYAQGLLDTDDPHRKLVVVAECCEWLAAKTGNTNLDDELVAHVSAILKSKEGEAFLRWAIDRINKK